MYDRQTSCTVCCTCLAQCACWVLGVAHDTKCRELQATCRRFEQVCKARDLTLHEHCFKVSYDTNIPRQSGLSGSSAIVCATFKCLLAWYDLTDKWPVPERPLFVLDVEQEELGIAAGLMDRVAQVPPASRAVLPCCSKTPALFTSGPVLHRPENLGLEQACMH
jgi:GHMP kinases N terminal domain